MSTIVTRQGKGLPLSNSELDANFLNLNADKLEAGALAPYLLSAIAASTYQPLLGYVPVNKAGDTFTGAVLTSNAGGFTANSAAKLWTDSNRGRLDLWEGAAQTKSLRVFNANGYGIVGMTSAENLELWTNGTPRLTLGGSGNVTASTNIIVANGSDSRVNLQVDGVTEGILTASTANVRLSSANAIPMTFGTNGVTRLTLTGTGYITTGASEYVGIGAQANTNNALRIARNLENGTSAYAVLSDGTFQSGVTVNGAGYRSVARTAAAAFTMASLHHYQAVQATLGAGSAITTQAGFVADSSLVGATNNYGFYGNIASGTGRWNLYMEGTAANYLGGSLTLNAGTANGVAYLNGSKVLTTGSALTFDGTNLGVGIAPVSGYKAAINGDIWQGNTGGVIIGSIINNGGWYELGGSANVNGLQFAHAATQRWMLSGSEQMRLTSTGLGIGTSSSSAPLTVKARAADSIGLRILQSSAGAASLQFTNDPVTAGWGGMTATSTYMDINAAGYVSFSIAGGERGRIDTNGQFGIGFTPNASQGQLQVWKNITGGAPATSGATDVNQVATIGGGGVGLGIGLYSSGAVWMQPRAFGNFSDNYNMVLLPNGGSLAISTTDLTYKLNVKGGRSQFISNGNQYAVGVGYSTGAGFWLGTDSGNTDLLLSDAGGSERLRVISNGTLQHAGGQYRTANSASGNITTVNPSKWYRLCSLAATNAGQSVEFIFAILGQHILFRVKFSKTTANSINYGGGILEVELLGSYLYGVYHPYKWRVVEGGTNAASYIDIQFPNADSAATVAWRVQVLSSWAPSLDHAQFPMTDMGTGAGTGGTNFGVSMGSGSGAGWDKQWFKLNSIIGKFAYLDNNLTMYGNQTPSVY
jgi:hypothetical protein